MTTELGCVNVIDDDDGLRGALGSLLRSVGYRVRLFSSTADYLASTLPDMPCCLVLDIRLSGENGLDFQESLAGQGHALPTILITGHGDIPMTVRGMRAGAVDFLPKPFEDDQLLTAIATALQADAARRAQLAQGAALQTSYEGLTPREKEVMALVVTGLMNKQVAARLDLSEITVKIHRGNVMRKMSAQSLADLVRMAEELGVRDDSIHRYNM
jgi:FixJ family two-component response regulator